MHGKQKFCARPTSFPQWSVWQYNVAYWQSWHLSSPGTAYLLQWIGARLQGRSRQSVQCSASPLTLLSQKDNLHFFACGCVCAAGLGHDASCDECTGEAGVTLNSLGGSGFLTARGFLLFAGPVVSVLFCGFRFFFVLTVAPPTAPVQGCEPIFAIVCRNADS